MLVVEVEMRVPVLVFFVGDRGSGDRYSEEGEEGEDNARKREQKPAGHGHLVPTQEMLLCRRVARSRRQRNNAL